MRRYLSHTLIAVLVLICPLTFSTDRVPDFKTTCVIKSAHGKKGAVTVAAVRCSGESPPRLYRNFSRQRLPPSPSIPHIGLFRLPTYGRAPPSVSYLLG